MNIMATMTIKEYKEYEGRVAHYMKVLDEMAQEKGIDTSELTREDHDEAKRIVNEKKARIDAIAEKFGIE
ncbi:hypothetical protein [Streptomyces atratus]|uniref:hypothetical protein n=1 Tax=Streptomyces atratus TaxID=1893 RepID=UPI0036465EF7